MIKKSKAGKQRTGSFGWDILMLDEAHTISEDYEMLTALIQNVRFFFNFHF